ncbi:MAG: DUF937 domain-containing protein [Deltaproteobacteria bacterium]|nr:DUF937 domain-containing protein [Deltaproteobacteria bacterium]
MSIVSSLSVSDVSGRAIIANLASRAGLPEAIAGKAMGMMLPALTSGLKRGMDDNGAGPLLEALEDGHHDQYVDDPESMNKEETKKDGNKILGHILGGKDASRAVASTVAGTLGIDEGAVKKMLPMVAALTMGGLSKGAKQAGIGKGSGDVLGKLGSLISADGAGDVIASLLK